jgi:hypothetical protein
MSGADDRPGVLPDGEWRRVWQDDLNAAIDAERIGRRVMAQVWQFDQKLFWRNFREYAAGVALLVAFGGQLVMGNDRIGALIGIVGVGFVMVYLWWKHRGLRPLDPTADVETYKLALLARVDGQIRLLRSVAYWYLLPLALPMLWQVANAWHRNPHVATTVLLVDTLVFGFVWWLNVVAGVRKLQAKRVNVESMFPRE